MNRLTNYKRYLGRRNSQSNTSVKLEQWKGQLNPYQLQDVDRGTVMTSMSREMSNSNYEMIALFQKDSTNGSKVAAVIRPTDYVAVGYRLPTVQTLTNTNEPKPDDLFQTLSKDFVTAKPGDLLVNSDHLAVRQHEENLQVTEEDVMAAMELENEQEEWTVIKGGSPSNPPK